MKDGESRVGVCTEYAERVGDIAAEFEAYDGLWRLDWSG